MKIMFKSLNPAIYVNKRTDDRRSRREGRVGLRAGMVRKRYRTTCKVNRESEREKERGREVFRM